MDTVTGLVGVEASIDEWGVDVTQALKNVYLVPQVFRRLRLVKKPLKLSKIVKHQFKAGF